MLFQGFFFFGEWIIRCSWCLERGAPDGGCTVELQYLQSEDEIDCCLEQISARKYCSMALVKVQIIFKLFYSYNSQ